MQRLTDLTAQDWYTKLPQPQRDLIETAIQTDAVLSQTQTALPDYSFLVFLLAKAYEGFVKDFLLNNGLINQATYMSKRFRIGRALNPDVRIQHRDEAWLFDDITQRCGGELARQLWETWLECRNRVVHYFPAKQIIFTRDEAIAKMKLVLDTMAAASRCSS